MKHKILIVDDDEKLLQSFERVLGPRFTTVTMPNGEGGLQALAQQGPFSLVISDYRMPGMNGVEFLAKVMERSPDTVRILLTGYADADTAIKAVNEGNIFRLLSKPCPPKVLAKALNDGLRLFEALCTEREILEKTLKANVHLLCDVLCMLRPEVFGRVSRIMPYVRGMSRELSDPAPWETETAAMLSMLGFITLPEVIVKRVMENSPLTEGQQSRYREHPLLAAKLLHEIPRMSGVADVVRCQEKQYDGAGVPEDGRKGDDIPLGSRILKVAVDFDVFISNRMPKAEALVRLQQRRGWYDMKVLGALDSMLGVEAKYIYREVTMLALEPGMVLSESVLGRRGTKEVILLSNGQELSEATIEFIYEHAKHYTIVEPIKVVIPVARPLAGAGEGDAQEGGNP